jgi:hypothetical protein
METARLITNPQRAVPASDDADEAFGQEGVRQYFLPALVALSVLLAVGSAVLWNRSFSLADGFSHTDGISTFTIRSVYGRVLVTFNRYALDDRAERSLFDGEWQYGVAPVPRDIVDGWKDSFAKRCGIEWRAEPLANLAISGWWLRVRWPLIMLLCLLGPAAWGIARLRRARARRAS